MEPEFCGWESSYLKIDKGKQINLSYADPERSSEIYNVYIETRELKKRQHHKMESKSFPRRVWDSVINHAVNVIHMIPPEKLNGRNTIEAVTG